jgi:hypothetical protein
MARHPGFFGPFLNNNRHSRDELSSPWPLHPYVTGRSSPKVKPTGLVCQGYALRMNSPSKKRKTSLALRNQGEMMFSGEKTITNEMN